MKITFIFPNIPANNSGEQRYFSHAAAYLAASCKKKGHVFEMFPIVKILSKNDFQDEIKKRKSDIIAISSIYHYVSFVKQWADWSKEVSPAPVIVGGIHTTLNPSQVISLPSVDYICCGDGEEAFTELCDELAAGRIPYTIRNIWYKKDGTIYKNELRPLVKDLDELELPDYTIHNPYKPGSVPVIISRGCPNACTYCSTPSLTTIYRSDGHYFRFMSPERAIELLIILKSTYPDMDAFVFNDSIMFPHKDWLERFSGLYKKKVGLPCIGNCRANMVDRDTAGLLKEMDCRLVCMGIECGNDYINNTVLGRKMTRETILNAFEIMHKSGIQTKCYTILGCPFETRSTMLETVKTTSQTKSEMFSSFIFYPVPGTVAFETSEKAGFLTNRQYLDNQTGVVLDQPTLSSHEVYFFHEYFQHLVRMYKLFGNLWKPAGNRIIKFADRLILCKYLPLSPLVIIKKSIKQIRLTIYKCKTIKITMRW